MILLLVRVQTWVLSAIQALVPPTKIVLQTLVSLASVFNAMTLHPPLLYVMELNVLVTVIALLQLVTMEFALLALKLLELMAATEQIVELTKTVSPVPASMRNVLFA